MYLAKYIYVESFLYSKYWRKVIKYIIEIHRKKVVKYLF